MGRRFLEHVVSGGKQGGGDREDGFLSAAAGLLTVPRGACARGNNTGCSQGPGSNY